ncbi:MAG: hypothetical protein J1G01_06850 [Clostridiales bacterium]|nr:hypothetical protein [Clostridiales bacterium]
MSIKQRIKSVWNKFTGKHDDGVKAHARKKTNRNTPSSDSELAAEEVIEKEVYPPKKSKACATKNYGTKKPASKRTRPTNYNYEMIDDSDNTCDSGKS